LINIFTPFISKLYLTRLERYRPTPVNTNGSRTQNFSWNKPGYCQTVILQVATVIRYTFTLHKKHYRFLNSHTTLGQYLYFLF